MDKVTISVNGGPPQTFDYTAGTAINVNSGQTSGVNQPSGTVVERGPLASNVVYHSWENGRGIPQAGTIERHRLDLTGVSTAGKGAANIGLAPQSSEGLWKATVTDANGQVIPLTLGSGEEGGKLVAGQYGPASFMVGDGDDRNGFPRLAAGVATIDLEIVKSGHYTLLVNYA